MLSKIFDLISNFSIFNLVYIFCWEKFYKRIFINLSFYLALPAFHLQFGNLYILKLNSVHKCAYCIFYDVLNKTLQMVGYKYWPFKKVGAIYYTKESYLLFLHFFKGIYLFVCHLFLFLSLCLFFFCHFSLSPITLFLHPYLVFISSSLFRINIWYNVIFSIAFGASVIWVFVSNKFTISN